MGGGRERLSSASEGGSGVGVGGLNNEAGFCEQEAGDSSELSGVSAAEGAGLSLSQAGCTDPTNEEYSHQKKSV